jgi:hypothetical protein
VDEGCGVDVFSAMDAASVPRKGGDALLNRVSSTSEFSWSDTSAIEESRFLLAWTGILHVLMFLQVSVSF